MYYSFAIESSYGVDSTTQDYVVDLRSEDVVENMEYVKHPEFHTPYKTHRYGQVKNVGGRVEFELTYGNLAWGVLFQSLLGQKVTLTGKEFVTSPESWNIITGTLNANLSATAETFTIDEYFPGEFDNVDGIIIGDEYITVSAISNGNVTGATRGSEGSTASSHNQYALVYGMQNSGSNSVDIISRYRSGFSFQLPTSLTAIISREDDYFMFPGTLFSDFVFNARPQEGVTTSFDMRCRDSGIVVPDSPTTAEDNNEMVSTRQINCYSMGNWIDIESFYFQVSNTLAKTPGDFFSNLPKQILLQNFSTYGQFNPVTASADFWSDYKADELKNLSMTICENKSFTNAYVLAFNDVKWGTMLHTLKSTRLIEDSIPFYCFDKDAFIIMIQRET